MDEFLLTWFQMTESQLDVSWGAVRDLGEVTGSLSLPPPPTPLAAPSVKWGNSLLP